MKRIKSILTSKYVKGLALVSGAVVLAAVPPAANAISTRQPSFADFLVGPPRAPHDRAFETFSVGMAYLGSLQTGDLVFFTRPGMTPKPIKFVLNKLSRLANVADGEHVGVIVRHPEHDYPYIVENTWRGIQVTPFEDRVLNTTCEDVMVRSLHTFRPANFDKKALEFVAAEAEESERDRFLRAPERAMGWLAEAVTHAVFAYQGATTPRAAPAVKRVDSMSTMRQQQHQQQQQQQAEGEKSKSDPNSTLKAAVTNPRLITALDADAKYGEQFLTAQQNHDVRRLPVPNVVSVAGELSVVAKTLQRTYNRLDRIQEKEEAAKNVSYFSKIWPWSSSSSSSSSNSATSSSSEIAFATLSKLEDSKEAIPMLEARARFLTARVIELAPQLVKQYTDEEKSPLWTFLNNADRPAFRDASFVAKFLQHMDILPSPTIMPAFMDAMKQAAGGTGSGSGSGKGGMGGGGNDDVDWRAVSAAGNLDLACLAMVKQGGTPLLDAKHQMKDPKAPNRLDTTVLRHLADRYVVRPPHGYWPVNFREQTHIVLRRGAVLGQEQFIVQSYNPPPFETRSK